MKITAFIMLLVPLVVEPKWLQLKSWAKNSARGTSFAVNTASIAIYSNIVINAHDGEFLILPSDFASLQNSSVAILEQINNQQLLEKYKYAREEEKMKNSNTVITAVLVVMLIFSIILMFRSYIKKVLCSCI